MLRSLLASTASNGARFVVALVVTFVMTPVYINQLGNYDYGIWEILGSVVGYLGLLDMGLRPTISRFIAYARNDQGVGDSQQVLFNTSLGLMQGVGITISLILAGWSLTFPNILAPADGAVARYAFVIQLFALHVLLSFPYFALESVFEGRLCYTTKNNIAIAHQVLGAVFLYQYLPVFDPLILLIAVNLATTASKLILLLALLHLSNFGAYRIRPTLFRGELVRRMLRFGSKSLLQGIAGQVSKRADAVLIGIFLGPQKIVFYNLAHMLLQRLSSLTQLAGHAFMPAFSTFHGAGEQGRMEQYFFIGTRYVYALHAATCAAIAIVGAGFLQLWIGPDYGSEARPLIWVLVAGALIAGSLPLHNRFLTALDRHGQLAILYSLRAALNVILTIILLPVMGLLGVAVATMLAQAIITPLIWRAVFRELQGTVGEYIRQTLAPVFGVVSVMAVIMLITRAFIGIESWLSLFGVLAAGGVSFLLLFSLIATGETERAFLRATIQRLRHQ